jgi:hypothetical protein
MQHARMKNWSISANKGEEYQAPECRTNRLYGFAYGHPKFPNGHPVETSTIISITDQGTHKIVLTRNTEYEIWPEDINPVLEKAFPGYYQRMAV